MPSPIQPIHYIPIPGSRLVSGIRSYRVFCGRLVYDDARNPEKVTNLSDLVTCRKCLAQMAAQARIAEYLRA